MTSLYEDRAVLLIDGQPLVDQFVIKSIAITLNQSVSSVEGMTHDRSGAGFVHSNLEIDITVNCNLPINGLIMNKTPETFDWEGQNATIQVFGTSSLYRKTFKSNVTQLTGVIFTQRRVDFSGVGRNGEHTLEFKAQNYIELDGGV